MFENTKSDMWGVKKPKDDFYITVYLLTVKLKALLPDAGLSHELVHV